MFDDDQVRTITAIDRSSPLPLYYQLKQILLRRIHNGDIGPGEALLSEKELQERFGVSRITVRRALSDLASEGYISRQAGRGTFVLQTKIEHRSGQPGGFRDDLAAQGFDVESRILQHGMQPAARHVARKLGIDEGQPLLYVKKIVYADNEPIGLVTGYHNLGEGIAFTRQELESDSIFPLLERKYGISLPRADRTIEATLALEDEARLLQVRPNAPMLLLESLVYNAQGQRVSFLKAVYRGDRYKYRDTIT